MKAGGKRKLFGGRFGMRGQLHSFLPVALCLLPTMLGLGVYYLLPSSFFARSNNTETAAPAPLDEAEADEVLRRAAQSALGVREGAVVVLDAQTGRVRALAGGRTAFEEATPPGSAIKPFTMLAALRAGALDADTRLRCPGRFRHEDFKLNCAHARYRDAFGPAQALANSCNYFFGRVAETLDGDAYVRTLREFGFGARTGGGDGEREAAGLLPRERTGVPEMLGESEEIRVTPAQMASAYAALFNGGRLLAPRAARPEGFTPARRAQLEVKPDERALLLEGMRGVVAYGTAARAGLATLPVYVFGKTGTSTPQDDWRAQGWFVGFAAGRARPGGDSSTDASQPSPEDVRLTVLVFLKRSRGAEAAELARPVFEAYARTLAADDDRQAARPSSNAEGARPSTSDNDEAASDADRSTSDGGEDGATVRVRLTRGDATLTLGLEDYVFGVVAAEGSVESELESLKALAVVVRSYALRNIHRHARDHFDFCDTTHCQRFLPVRNESARPEFYELAHRAVRETAGEVLREPSGAVAESYFSAACGGRTADIQKLWGVARAPAYLRGVRDDACSGAQESWTDVIPSAQLLRALRADGRSDVGARLDGVRVTRRDQTGRAAVVQLDGARRRTLTGWDFKIIVGRTLGWNVLKSSRFEVTRAGAAFVFRGTGFGHGLGLCQLGAHVSASRGASYRQILGRYFPGTTVGAPRDAAARRAPNVESGATIDESRAVRPSLTPDSSEPVGEVASARFQTASFEPAVFRPAAYEPQSARASLRSEHFRLSYPARVARREAEGLLRGFESAYADVSRRLARASIGASPPDVEVVVYETTGDFTGTTGQAPWVAAVTEGRRIHLQPLEVLRRRGLSQTTPRHEFVHAALEALGGGAAPRWLVEGLAAYVAGEGPQLSRAASGERISTDELERRLARPASAAEMRALYAAAYAEVSALVRREGEAAVWRRAVR
ncbi:MAG TPA: SpoIID/LytB domain-containing protein [Pyrinomonadaceae bacterium]|nr:SpoIID/LytB domain-containing protein [Pyrinomonadaceae bacterium]